MVDGRYVDGRHVPPYKDGIGRAAAARAAVHRSAAAVQGAAAGRDHRGPRRARPRGPPRLSQEGRKGTRGMHPL
eukprot:5345789-Pyramimonas_sp.AAC.1